MDLCISMDNVYCIWNWHQKRVWFLFSFYSFFVAIFVSDLL